MGRKNRRNTKYVGKKDGRCDICGKPLSGFKSRCNYCSKIIRTAFKKGKLHCEKEAEEK